MLEVVGGLWTVGGGLGGGGYATMDGWICGSRGVMNNADVLDYLLMAPVARMCMLAGFW